MQNSVTLARRISAINYAVKDRKGLNGCPFDRFAYGGEIQRRRGHSIGNKCSSTIFSSAIKDGCRQEAALIIYVNARARRDIECHPLLNIGSFTHPEGTFCLYTGEIPTPQLADFSHGMQFGQHKAPAREIDCWKDRRGYRRRASWLLQQNEMINKKVADITEADVQLLVDTQRVEDRYIDFKKDWSDSGFDGLAADVCAFANTDGGDIVVGMASVDRVASKVLGVACTSVDQQIRKVEDAIRARIEPRVSGFGVWHIPCKNGDGVFVIRVSPSASAPHRLVEGNKFYARASAGNNPMDIFQVREAFLRGTLAEERVREFRKKRIAELYVAQNLRRGQAVWTLLHVVSLPAMGRSSFIDGKKLYDAAFEVPPLGAFGPANPQIYNLDGILRQSEIHAVQIFRDGRIEGKIRHAHVPTLGMQTPNPPIALAQIGLAVHTALPKYASLLSDLDYAAPYSAMLTLINTSQQDFASHTSNQRTDLEILEIPDVTIIDLQADTLAAGCRQLTDVLYQSFGLPATEPFR
jgi:hypothetical protein